MKRKIQILAITGFIWLAGCSKEPVIIVEPELEIPNDTFAFYTMEGFPNWYVDLSTLTVDSIRRFGKIFLDLEDIVSYDTLEYTFEVIGDGKENIDSLWLPGAPAIKPLAAVSMKKVLFFVDVRSPVASFFPDWYYFELMLDLNETIGHLNFEIPPIDDFAIGYDLRMDSTMISILSGENKIR
jgi:hypothetical protein